MKMKRILSFICVLALALSMCSMFSFATAPEARATELDVGDYGEVNRMHTYVYNTPSTSSGYAYPEAIPIGTDMRVTGKSGNFYKVAFGYKSQWITGYVLKLHLS